MQIRKCRHDVHHAKHLSTSHWDGPQSGEPLNPLLKQRLQTSSPSIPCQRRDNDLCESVPLEHHNSGNMAAAALELDSHKCDSAHACCGNAHRVHRRCRIFGDRSHTQDGREIRSDLPHLDDHPRIFHASESALW